MEPIRLHQLNPVIKWAISLYLLLSSLGFGIAGMISHDRYGLDHSQTAVFYRGDEAQMAFPKLYGQLIQTAHVHSFTMPLVFLSVWLALAFTPLSGALKKFLIAGGALSILIYNAAPFLVRYASERWVSLFTVGGIGLFVFFLVPTALALYETWLGFSPGRDRGGPWSKST